MSQGPLPTLWGGTLAGDGKPVGRGRWSSEMQRYNHSVGLKVVSEYMPQERNAVTLADETDQYGLPVARDHLFLVRQRPADEPARARPDAHEPGRERRARVVGAGERHLPPERHRPHGRRIRRTSVVDADCRSWDVPNLWICDGSVFPTVGGVNPSLTIQAIACRTADRIKTLAMRGEL